MKIIKCIAGAIAFLLLCSLISSFSVFADEGYSELFEQKKKYFQEYDFDQGETFCQPYNPFPEVTMTVLLYTDVARSFTLKKVEVDTSEGGDLLLTSEDTWFYSWVNFAEYYISCPEIDQAIKDSKFDLFGSGFSSFEGSSFLRACIQYFNISKEELKKANKLMQEDPDAIRGLLTCLTDDEYENARHDNGMFCIRPIPDFAMEALYLEDDVVANNLLCTPYSIYLEDPVNRVVTRWEIVEYDNRTKELFAACDLTGDWAGDFIERYRSWVNFDILDAARKEQLKTPPQTGDTTAVYLTASLLSLGVLTGTVSVTVRKRKKAL